MKCVKNMRLLNRHSNIFTLALLVLLCYGLFNAQTAVPTKSVTIALPYPVSNLDMLTSPIGDGSAENIRSLIFNSLVKRDDTLEQVGDLAKEIKITADGKSVTFVLRSGILFHNGSSLTSADVKYTFDELFKSNGFKSGSFYDIRGPKRIKYIDSIRIVDPVTIVFDLVNSSYRGHFMASIGDIPIIPIGTVDIQKDHPVGTGPFKFVSIDQTAGSVDLSANPDYWEGSPTINSIKLLTPHTDEFLWSYLLSGKLDLAFVPASVKPGAISQIVADPNLTIQRFNGSNIQYLGFNTKSRPLHNVKIRQAIAYAIDRPRIIKDVLSDNARIADSVLPPESWAFDAGTKYDFDLKKARTLLKQGGYRKEKLVIKLGSGNESLVGSAQQIQENLAAAGINAEVEIVEANIIRYQLMKGEFEMYLGTWIGGNQDPLFLLDLFTTAKIPSSTQTCCNRSRYSNRIVDNILESARDAADQSKAKSLYARAWQIISDDLPLLPLWHPSNIVIVNKRLRRIELSPTGSWKFTTNIESLSK